MPIGMAAPPPLRPVLSEFQTVEFSLPAPDRVMYAEMRAGCVGDSRISRVRCALVQRHTWICGLVLNDRHSKVRSLTVAVLIWVVAQPARLRAKMR